MADPETSQSTKREDNQIPAQSERAKREDSRDQEIEPQRAAKSATDEERERAAEQLNQKIAQQKEKAKKAQEAKAGLEAKIKAGHQATRQEIVDVAHQEALANAEALNLSREAKDSVLSDEQIKQLDQTVKEAVDASKSGDESPRKASLDSAKVKQETGVSQIDKLIGFVEQVDLSPKESVKFVAELPVAPVAQENQSQSASQQPESSGESLLNLPDNLEDATWQELNAIKEPQLNRPEPGKRLTPDQLEENANLKAEYAKVNAEKASRIEELQNSGAFDPYAQELAEIADDYKQGQQESAEKKMEALKAKADELTKDEEQGNEKNAGLISSLIAQRVEQIKNENFPPEAREVSDRIMAATMTPGIVDRKSAGEMSELAREQALMMGWGSYDKPMSKDKFAGSDDAYREYQRDWMMRKIAKIDRVEISPNDLVHFREYNELLQSLPLLGDDVLSQFSAWKHNYISWQTYEASSAAKDLLPLATGQEDSFKYLLGLEGRDLEHVDKYTYMNQLALAKLIQNRNEWMRPDMKGEDPGKLEILRDNEGNPLKDENGKVIRKRMLKIKNAQGKWVKVVVEGQKTAAQRRLEIKRTIAKEILAEMRKQGYEKLTETDAKLAVTIGERLWTISGVKARMDIVYAKGNEGVAKLILSDKTIPGYQGGIYEIARDQSGRVIFDATQDGGVPRYGLLPLDEEKRLIRKFGGVKASELYSWGGDGRFHDRRLSVNTKEALRTDTKNSPQYSELWNWYGYDKGGPRPKDFLEKVGIKVDNILSQTMSDARFKTEQERNNAFVKAISEALEQKSWDDSKGMWGVWQDNKRKIADTRTANQDPKKGFLRNPTDATFLALLESGGLDQYDYVDRDFVPKVMRGLWQANQKKGYLINPFPHIEFAKSQKMEIKYQQDRKTGKYILDSNGQKIPDPDQKYQLQYERESDGTYVKDGEDNNIPVMETTRHLRWRKIGQKETDNPNGYDRWTMEAKIKYFEDLGRFDHHEAEKFRREILGFDFWGFEFFGLWKRKKVYDPDTDNEYYVDRIPGIGPVRGTMKLIERGGPKMLGGLLLGLFEMVKAFVAESGVASPPAGGKRK